MTLVGLGVVIFIGDKEAEDCQGLTPRHFHPQLKVGLTVRSFYDGLEVGSHRRKRGRSLAACPCTGAAAHLVHSSDCGGVHRRSP
jgi:hypothetical protein